MHTKITYSKENTVKQGFTFHAMTMYNIAASIILLGIFINVLHRFYLLPKSNDNIPSYSTEILLILGFSAFINFLIIIYNRKEENLSKQLVPTIILVANINQPLYQSENEKRTTKIDLNIKNDADIITHIETNNGSHMYYR